MGFGGNKRNQMMSEINVTPLVDVMLVLLIIFMIKWKDGHLISKYIFLIVDLDK